MYIPTAHGITSIGIKEPAYSWNVQPDQAFVERYLRRFGVVASGLHENRPSVYRIEPQWLAIVGARIRRSIAPFDQVNPEDGSVLREDVAQAATSFLDATADLLPGEPFIYSSRRGDLVAEFKGVRGTLTSVISPESSVLFAVVDGTPIERVIPEGGDARKEVREITKMLLTGQHGLEAR